MSLQITVWAAKVFHSVCKCKQLGSVAGNKGKAVPHSKPLTAAGEQPSSPATASHSLDTAGQSYALQYHVHAVLCFCLCKECTLAMSLQLDVSVATLAVLTTSTSSSLRLSDEHMLMS